MIEPIVLGSLGAGIILLAFVLGQMHVWKDTYFSYDLLNAIGSILLIYYAWVGSSWPFLVLNGVWALVSIKDLIADFKRNSHKRSVRWWNKWMQ